MRERDTRSPGRRLAVNTSLRAGTEVVGKIASLILFAYIARALGGRSLGNFVLALALVQIVSAIAAFGIDRMSIRDIATDPSALDRVFYPGLLLKTVTCLAGVATVSAGVALLSYPREVLVLVAVLGVSQVVQLATASAQMVFQAYERMEYYFLTAVPNKLIAAALGIVVLILGGGLTGVAVANLVAAVASLAIAMVVLIRRFARPSLRARGWRALAHRSAPFGFQEIFGQIIFRIDIVLLSLLSNAAVVGAYGAAYRLLEATLFVVWSVGTSILPMYSYLRRDERPGLDEVFQGSVKLVVVLMLPIAVTMLVCARPIIDVLFGLPEFADAVTVLRWLAFAVVAYAIGHLAGILVLVRRAPRLTVYATGAVAMLNIALNLALIPILEGEGAAIATLATEVVLAATALMMARTVVALPRLGRMALAPMIALSAMALTLAPVSGTLWLALPLGVCMYVLVLAVLESRPSGDLSSVRTMLARRLETRRGRPAA